MSTAIIILVVGIVFIGAGIGMLQGGRSEPDYTFDRTSPGNGRNMDGRNVRR